MKKLKLFILSFFLLQGLNSDAQITLQHSYTVAGANVSDLQGIYLSHSGFKLALWNQADTLVLFNLNLSLFKTLIIPGNTVNLQEISWISEGLFDTDTTHLAYMAQYGFNLPDSLKIYDESGNTLLSVSSGDQSYSQQGFSGPAFNSIFPTDSGTYMFINVWTPNFSFLLYKIPGSLPCIPGCSGKNLITYTPDNNNQNYGLRLYPNPVTSYTNIYYTLPSRVNSGEIVLYDLAGREMKKYTVDARMDHIRLTTSDLKAGTYFYQLIAGQQTTAAKKMVVIK